MSGVAGAVAIRGDKSIAFPLIQRPRVDFRFRLGGHAESSLSRMLVQGMEGMGLLGDWIPLVRFMEHSSDNPAHFWSNFERVATVHFFQSRSRIKCPR